jgi:hypothetical protein
MGALRLSLSPRPLCIQGVVILSRALSFRNNKKRQIAMFKHTKVRQAGLILFATTLLLILPNLTKVIG